MKSFIAPLAVMMLAGIAPLAQASIQIHYYIDGDLIGVICNLPGPNSVACTDVTTGNVQISGLSAHANLAGTPSLALASSSDAIIYNADSIAHTIHIDVMAQGFAKPTTPPNLNFDSSISGTNPVASPGSTMSFKSCVDTTDSASGCAIVGGAPYLSATLTPSITGKGFYGADAPTLTISSLAASFAMDEHLDLTIGAGGQINFSGSTTLTPVPEPMSIALLGGVVLLTSRLIRRKQNQAS